MKKNDLLKYENCVAFVHWGIRGAKRNDHNKDTDGVPLDYLKPFRRVFSGHYHYRSKLENVQYIGSPLQQNFAEMGQDQGVLIYDSEKETVKLTPAEIEKRLPHMAGFLEQLKVAYLQFSDLDEM